MIDPIAVADEIAVTLGPAWVRRPDHTTPWSTGIVRSGKLGIHITAAGQRLQLKAYDATGRPGPSPDQTTCAATHAGAAIAAAIAAGCCPKTGRAHGGTTRTGNPGIPRSRHRRKQQGFAMKLTFRAVTVRTATARLNTDDQLEAAQ